MDEEQRMCLARLEEALSDCAHADLILHSSLFYNAGTIKAITRREYEGQPTGLPLEKMDGVAVPGPFKQREPPFTKGARELTEIARESHKEEMDYYAKFPDKERVDLENHDVYVDE